MKHKIIISLAAFILVSFIFLSWTAEQQEKADFWTVSFENPQSENLNFIVENHTENKDFQWKIMQGKQEINSGSAEIQKGDIKKVEFQIDDLSDTKISIVVSTNDETKKIYQTF